MGACVPCCAAFFAFARATAAAMAAFLGSTASGAVFSTGACVPCCAAFFAFARATAAATAAFLGSTVHQTRCFQRALVYLAAPLFSLLHARQLRQLHLFEKQASLLGGFFAFAAKAAAIMSFCVSFIWLPASAAADVWLHAAAFVLQGELLDFKTCFSSLRLHAAASLNWMLCFSMR